MKQRAAPGHSRSTLTFRCTVDRDYSLNFAPNSVLPEIGGGTADDDIII